MSYRHTVWLLRTYERLYTGRPLHVNTISPLLLVSHEAISALAQEKTHTDSATIVSFCARMLRQMAKVYPIAGLILRSSEQVAARYSVFLPAETSCLIEDLEKEQPQVVGIDKVQSRLPIDLGVMHTTNGSDQLGYLVNKLAETKLGC